MSGLTGITSLEAAQPSAKPHRTFRTDDRVRHRSGARAWVLLAVLVLAWFSFAATDFWLGHLWDVTESVGDVGGNVTSMSSGWAVRSCCG